MEGITDVSILLRTVFTRSMVSVNQVGTNKRLICRLQWCMELLGPHIQKIPKDVPIVVLNEIISLLENVRKFCDCFKDEDWFVNYIINRTNRTVIMPDPIDQFVRLSHILKTKLQLDIELQNEDFRTDLQQFHEEILEQLDRLHADSRKCQSLNIDSEKIQEFRAESQKCLALCSIEWHIPHWKIELQKQIYCGRFGLTSEGNYEGVQVAVERYDMQSENKAQSAGFKSFLSEFDAIFKLRHKSLVQIYGASLVPEISMVMEYCENGSIHTVVQNPDVYAIHNCHRLVWIKQLAEGLVYLHTRKTLHGDVTSMNALIDKFGVAKWTDFGLSSKRGRTSLLKNCQSPERAESWWSPETFEGQYTQKSEIWCLGLILYELIEFKLPFYDAPPKELRSCIQDVKLKFTKRATVLPILKELMTQCLKVDQEKRPGALDIIEKLKEEKTGVAAHEFLSLLKKGQDDSFPRSSASASYSSHCLNSAKSENISKKLTIPTPERQAKTPSPLRASENIKVRVVVAAAGVYVRSSPDVSKKPSSKVLHFGDFVLVQEEHFDGCNHWIKHDRGWSCSKLEGRVLIKDISPSSSFIASLLKAKDSMIEARDVVWTVVNPEGVQVHTEPNSLSTKRGRKVEAGETLRVTSELIGLEHWLKHDRGWTKARGRDNVVSLCPNSGSYVQSRVDISLESVISSKESSKNCEIDSLDDVSQYKVWRVGTPKGVNIRKKPKTTAKSVGTFLRCGETVVAQKHLVTKRKHWILHSSGWSLARRVDQKKEGKTKVKESKCFLFPYTGYVANNTSPTRLDAKTSSGRIGCNLLPNESPLILKGFSTAKENFWRVVARSGVYVRTGPRENAKPVGVLKMDKIIRGLEIKNDGEW
eukprot:CAMPEP_0184491952 /NCGR_PEP_ID=MMETSP0113_2-20130426/21856_1 /TAXON_ID=91329 /ORGANISM="Norrisiella sphaerica, Strain BC52" /LENGTH=871 /DNA_ID=CAMNT_0026876535 /DNA_START=127 /DNA_END=2739 /DNA_ORIENTATION=+